MSTIELTHKLARTADTLEFWIRFLPGAVVGPGSVLIHNLKIETTAQK
jgi:hypothetical protein